MLIISTLNFNNEFNFTLIFTKDKKKHVKEIISCEQSQMIINEFKVFFLIFQLMTLHLL